MKEMLPDGQSCETARRLEVRKQILDLIHQRRETENNAGIGACIEDHLIRDEIASLEPGAEKPTHQ